MTLDEENLWSSFKAKVRKNVNKANKSNLNVIIDEQGKFLDEFLEIYYSTMDRRDAGSGYYFSREYFQNIINKLSGNYVFIHILKENKIISTELVLVSNDNMYSFLGGTLEEYFEYRPNDLLKFEIIKWGKQRGIKYFILGGGYIPHDGIYSYKLAFAPSGEYPFYVGKQIFIENIYQQLVQDRIAEDINFDVESKFFPLYRS